MPLERRKAIVEICRRYNVAMIEDEQRYMWARERAARDLNEATNASVMRFSLLELLTMVLVGAGQVWAMKSYFERTNKF